MGDDSLRTEQLTVLLFGVGVAAVVVTLYHCFAACWCHRHQSRNDAAPPPATEPLDSPTSTTFDNSVAQLIPAHKHRKGTCPVVGDGTCAVCLSEFEDGEDLRTMPECSHSFHVPCIDAWLRSHPTCPVCRTDATPSPSPRPFGRVSPDYLAGGEVGALESIVVQSRYSNTAIS